MTLSRSAASVPYVSYAMRTFASSRPESSGSAPGRSTDCVRMVPTEPRVSDDGTEHAAFQVGRGRFQMQRLEQCDAQAEEARIAAVARAARRDAEHVDDPRRTVAEQDDPVREVDGLVEI